MSSVATPDSSPDSLNTSLDPREVRGLQAGLDDDLLEDASPFQASGGAMGDVSPRRVDPARTLFMGEPLSGVTMRRERAEVDRRRGNTLGADEASAMMEMISDPPTFASDPDAREAIKEFLRHAPDESSTHRESSPHRESISNWLQVWQEEQLDEKKEDAKAKEALKAIEAAVAEGKSRRGIGRKGLRELFSQENGGVQAFVDDDMSEKDQRPTLLEMAEGGGDAYEPEPESGASPSPATQPAPAGPPEPDASFMAELEENLSLFRNGVEDEEIEGLIRMRKWAIIESSNLQDMYKNIKEGGLSRTSEDAGKLNELYYTINTLLYMATLADDKISVRGGDRVADMEGGGAPAPASRRASRRRRSRKSSRRKRKISKRKKYTKRRKMSKKRRSSRKKLKSRKRR